jgi:hypothetical protein
MVVYRKGAEAVPLQQINRSLPILVIVYDLKNDDKVVEEKRIDYANFEDRKYLGRISFWAFNNHCSVETISLADAEEETLPNG